MKKVCAIGVIVFTGVLLSWRPGLSAAPRATWTFQISGVSSSLRGVSAVSDRVVWASGSNNTILRTTNGGESWTRLATPSTDPLDFRDIDAVSADTAYVMSIGSGQLSRIYKTTDGGQKWTPQFTNGDTRAFFDAMTFWDGSRGIAVSDSVEGRFYFLTTTNGGRNWTYIPVDRLPPAIAGEGFFAASGTNVTVRGNRIWIGTGATNRARVLRSIDRGLSWDVSDTPIAANQTSGIYSIAFRDDLHGIVVGGDYAKEREAVDNAAITSDGGVTWTLVKKRGLSGFRSVVQHVPGTASSWIAVGPAGSDISEDDGLTWTPIEGPGFHTFAFAPGRKVGWGAGARGGIGKLDLR
jgi:photosystem II stability/assembly factor-like uncharacterized protein